MSNLSIHEAVIRDKGAVLLQLAGDLDAHTYKAVKEEFERLFAAKNFRIIADLSNLNYISSSGVEVFVYAAHEANLHNGKLVLLSMSEDIRAILDLLEVGEIAPIASSFTQALMILPVTGKLHV